MPNTQNSRNDSDLKLPAATLAYLSHQARTTTSRRNHWARIGFRIVAVLLVGLFLMTSHLSAQNSFGKIVGVVVDQSGAVVPGAPVMVTNTATGVVSTVRTQSDGSYTAINLVPGPYVVSVEMPGFSKSQTGPVNLTVNQTLRANLALHPGSVSATVNVSATQTLLNTDTSTVSSEISSTQVSDLPLQSRNFLSLLLLAAGTIEPPTTSSFFTDTSGFTNPLSGGPAFVGGARSSSNAYLLDGIDDNNPAYQTPAISPPIDAIQDMRLMSKDYSAAYGGGADMVSIATKSGTNHFHGTVYDFFQNDFLDATNQSFGNPAIKPVLRYNQFGESVGGPVWIPKIINGHNKLFFFTDYEGLRTHTDTTAFALFPTAAELSGNFLGDPPIYNPATGQPFKGNQIPNTSIGQIAKNVIKFGYFATPDIPLTSTGYNTDKVLATPNNTDEWMIRVDYKINPANSLFVRYSASSESVGSPSIAPFYASSTITLGKNVGIDYTHIISPNLVNDLRVGLDRPVNATDSVYPVGTANVAEELGFGGVTGTPATYAPPYLEFGNGYSNVGANPADPGKGTVTIYDVGDNLTFIKGAHDIEVGGEFKHEYYFQSGPLEPNGLVAFDGEYTAGPLNPAGNSIADFLLGLASGTEIGNGLATVHYNSLGYSFFGEDNWKINKKLTLNLGLRYGYQAPFQEENNRFSIFNPAGDNLLTPDAAIVSQLQDPLIGLDPSRYIFNPDHKDFAPRIGFAYRPFERTVVHAGYGIFYVGTEEADYTFGIRKFPVCADLFSTGNCRLTDLHEHLVSARSFRGAAAGLKRPI